jgi:transcriptional regulator with XRE-family HTH domain
MSRDMCEGIGREITLARSSHALSMRAAARLARVAPRTQSKVEAGSPTVRVEILCRVASAMGLKVWGRAFPATEPSLRDTGQLWIADSLRRRAHPSLSVAIEHALGNLRSADAVFFGATEIIHVEIERLITDYQAQYRRMAEKRDLLAEEHRRPVRLVLAIEDTARNRSAVRPHTALIATAFSAGSRDVLRALQSGTPLGRDGIVWIRRKP